MTTITTDVIKVKIQGISNDIEAKIDTGAAQSSLHGDHITVKDDVVIFQLNDRIYRAPLETNQDVSSSDGGTQSRPVIKASIEIEGKHIETLLNLNDRSEMPQQLLIGQDVIRAAELTLQFTNDGNRGTEEEEVSKSPEPTREQPVAVDTPPVVNPSVPADVSAKLFDLSSEISETYRHVGELQQALNRISMQVLALIKEVGAVSKPGTAPVQEPEEQATKNDPTDLGFKPYEPK